MYQEGTQDDDQHQRRLRGGGLGRYAGLPATTMGTPLQCTALAGSEGIARVTASADLGVTLCDLMVAAAELYRCVPGQVFYWEANWPEMLLY